MKLSFSTLGCPDFSWQDIYSMAKDLGFDGIELRGLGDEIFSIHAKPFQPEHIDKTIEQLKQHGHFEEESYTLKDCVKLTNDEEQ